METIYLLGTLILITFILFGYKVYKCDTKQDRLNIIKRVLIVLVCIQILDLLNNFLNDYLPFSFLISSVIALLFTFLGERLFIKGKET